MKHKLIRPTTKRLAERGSLLAMFCAAFVLTVLIQWTNGAFSKELGSYPDEAAHYVSGLFVRDFIVSGRWLDPIGFAEEYYLHYPKLAIGHWGLVFYVIQAAWSLLFGTSKTATLLLIATITAAVSTSLFAITARSSRVVAFGIALLLITTPMFQLYTAAVMMETLTALLVLWGAVIWARFLEVCSFRRSLGFGMVAAVAILTRGNGLLLALVPPISLVVSAKYRLLLKPQFWLPVVVVILLAGPWYAWSLGMQHKGWASQLFSVEFSRNAVPFYAREIIGLAGIGIFSVAVLGGVLSCRTLNHDVTCDRETDAMPVAMLSLLAAAFVFHVLVPSGLADRYMIVAIAPLLFFVGRFFVEFGNFVKRRGGNHQVVTAIATVVLVSGYYLEVGWGHVNRYYGFSRVVEELHANPDYRNSVLLVSSDPRGDGMFISEVATRDNHRPSKYALRASKTLATSQWSGGNPQVKFNSIRQVADWLDETPVGVLVFDDSIPVGSRYEHEQLKAAILLRADQWQLLGRFPVARNGLVTTDGIAVYLHLGYAGKPLSKLEINMRNMLGRSISHGDDE